MNKAEQAQMEAYATEAALRWPTEAEPQPMTYPEIHAAARPHQSGRTLVMGWVMNAFTGRVGQGWSTGTVHGTGDPAHTGARKMGQIYRTEHEARVAMRWEMCRTFARKLRAVDKGETGE